MEFKLEALKIHKPDDANIIIWQAHFIKSAEDIYEAVTGTAAHAKFGLAFCEASGKCLVRVEGNDAGLQRIAADNALLVGAGHSFFIVMKDAYPINVLNAIKNVPEVCNIFCATANPLEVVVAVTSQGRGILGVVDGFVPKGVEGEEDERWRKELLRKIGYKK